MFEKFQDYMYYLLYGALKKISKTKNQFYILFKVFGEVFDQTKQDIFKVREESMIISASEKMLEEHGRDRDMQKLKGEDIENYRIRLSMKNIIAERAGTNEGILLALKTLGYEKSYIEPYYIYDTERWAEFIVYLSGKNLSSISDLQIIDNEIMRVKSASSMPAYGLPKESVIKLITSCKVYNIKYNMCGTFKCGTKPYYTNQGISFKTNIELNSNKKESSQKYRMTGTFKSGEERL
ncbi:hypothetical protein KQI38_09245 [Tissierella carlieri]|uniref:hypothetical protein n=1 Tax=Tissierella carlieri TaxID=689904 RepID=UPI001C10D055|nr:hypothetical protein [Tissierella carlieri]MBU5312211.1 hypothetical protein [Tissierella carlieri]